MIKEQPKLPQREPRLLGRRAGARDRALRALAGPRVRVSALTANRQVLAVTEPPVAAEIHQALDVERGLTTEVTLHLERGLDVLTDLPDLVFREILGSHR